jgi:hypothetical protein
MALITFTNLVVNGDFELVIANGTTAGSNQWSSNFANNPTRQTNPTPIHNEGGSYALQNTGSVNGAAYAQLSSNIAVTAGRKYWLSCLTRFEGTKYSYTIQFYNNTTALANGISAYIIGGGTEGVRNTWFKYDGGAAVGAQSAGGIWTSPTTVNNFPLRIQWSGGNGNQLRHNWLDNLMMIDYTVLSQAPYNLNDTGILSYARIINQIHGYWNGSKVIDIPDGPLTINTTQTLGNGRRGESYSEFIDVSGGWTPYTFVLQSGQIPQGLNLNESTGEISGTISNIVGNYGTRNFIIQVTDGINTLVSKAYSIFVDASPIIITQTLPNMVEGIPVNFQVQGDGSVGMMWSVIDGVFPNGISISSSGLISGTTDDLDGDYTVTLKVDNGINPPATRTYLFSISSKPFIVNDSFSDAISGELYNEEIILSGAEPITVAQTDGDLSIIGIYVIEDNGKWYLRGTPVVPDHNTYIFTLTAENELGQYQETFNLVVGVKPTIITTTLPYVIQGSAYSTTLQGSGSTPTSFRLVSGNFPTGIILNPNGTIYGTTSVLGTFNNIVIEISNIYGVSQRTFTLTVNQPTENATITTNTIPNGSVGTSYSFQVVATGFPIPTFGTTVANFPPGLSINSAGLITGNPTTPGSYTFTLVATNNTGTVQTDSRIYTVVIGSTPQITAVSPLTGTQGRVFIQSISATGYPTPTWSATGMPSGMTINTTNGSLQWNNPIAGSYNISVTVTNSSGYDTKPFVINIMLPPQITTSSLPRGVLNQLYTPFTMTATGDGTKLWSIVESSFPNGMSISSTGIISGTPTEYGSFSIFIQVETEYGINARSFNINIDGPPIWISPTNLPDAGDGAPYTYQLVVDGTPPFTFGVASSSILPPWLSLNPNTGELSSSNPIVGIYNFSLTCTNNIGTSTKAFTLEVKTPSILNDSTLYSKLNTPFSVTFEGGGQPPFTFTWISGNVPSGLYWDGVDTLSGIPDIPGIYPFTISVQNALSSNTKDFTLYVGDFVVITTESLTIGEVNVFYSDTLTVTGTPPISLTMTGSIPGLTYNPSTRIISGTPTIAGLYSLIFTGTNILGSVVKQFNVLITEPTAIPPPNITNTTLMNGILGIYYSDFVLATGDHLIWSWFSGIYPIGLELNQYTGEISGIPQGLGGYFTFSVICFNEGGYSIQSYTIFIATPPLIITHSAPEGILNQPYYFDINVVGDPTITFSLVFPDILPSGLTLNSSTGEITGTPDTVEEITFRIKAANSVGENIAIYTINIIKPITGKTYMIGTNSVEVKQVKQLFVQGSTIKEALEGYVYDGKGILVYKKVSFDEPNNNNMLFMRFNNTTGNLVNINSLYNLFINFTGGPELLTALLAWEEGDVDDILEDGGLADITLSPGNACLLTITWKGGMFSLSGTTNNSYRDVLISAGGVFSGDFDIPNSFMSNLFNNCTNYNQKMNDTFDASKWRPGSVGSNFMLNTWANTYIDELILKGDIWVGDIYPLQTNSAGINDVTLNFIKVDSKLISDYQSSSSWTNIDPNKFISW